MDTKPFIHDGYEIFDHAGQVRAIEELTPKEIEASLRRLLTNFQSEAWLKERERGGKSETNKKA